jgi:hypothetical protein
VEGLAPLVQAFAKEIRRVGVRSRA